MAFMGWMVGNAINLLLVAGVLTLALLAGWATPSAFDKWPPMWAMRSTGIRWASRALLVLVMAAAGAPLFGTIIFGVATLVGAPLSDYAYVIYAAIFGAEVCFMGWLLLREATIRTPAQATEGGNGEQPRRRPGVGD